MMVQFEELPSAYTIAIYDNMGRQVFQEAAINETRYLLQKQNLGAGVYFVNIQFEDTRIAPVKTKVIFQ